tara:strand:+ start:456 stop:560 length:105 start_codon:yes stop_codon:yes gene_type:complete
MYGEERGGEVRLGYFGERVIRKGCLMCEGVARKN